MVLIQRFGYEFPCKQSIYDPNTISYLKYEDTK